MTQKQAHQLERASAIAARDGLMVAGKGRTKDGRAVYAVPSRRQSGRWHLVIVAGAQLVCDCEASRYGRICAHRAAVRDRLRAERQASATSAASSSCSSSAASEAERAYREYLADLRHEGNAAALAPSL